MAYRKLILALSMIAAASPAMAGQPEPMREEMGAPAAGPGARYCLKIEPITGTRIETVRCETREEWARLEVDLDKEWPKEGVRVIG